MNSMQSLRRAVLSAGEQLLATLPFILIKRGYDYFSQQRVQIIDTDSQELIRARVKGTELYNVTVDLDDIPASRCTCPYPGTCKHIAAVVFSLYQAVDDAKKYLQKAKRAALKDANAPSDPLPTQTAAGEAQVLTATVRPETGSLQAWMQIWEAEFRRLSLNRPLLLFERLPVFIESVTRIAKSWDPIRGKWFLIHAILFAMEKAEAWFHTNKVEYLPPSSLSRQREAMEVCTDAFSRVLDGMQTEWNENRVEHETRNGDQDRVQNETRAGDQDRVENETRDGNQDRNKDTSKVDEYARLLLDRLQRLACPVEQTVSTWHSLYQQAWWILLNRPDWQEAERVRLDSQLEEECSPSRQRDWLLLLRADADIRENRDEAAMSRLAQRSQLELDHLAFYFSMFRKQQDWERLRRWLEWLLPYLPDAPPSLFQTLCSYWVHLAKQETADDKWVEALLTLLPRSASCYEQYLLAVGRYRQWVDYQLSCMVSPLALDRETLVRIESVDPALLLPLYHLAAEHAIEGRNRTAYREAILLLRQLQALYRRLEQTDVWNHYLRHLTAAYGRLRAFQEELRRGKLIP